MTTAGLDAPGRAKIDAKTLRQDRWWIQPVITAVVLVSFIVYSTWRAFANADYFVEPYISPFYSPCLATNCVPGTGQRAARRRLVDALPRAADPHRAARLPADLLLLPQGLLPVVLALAARVRRRRAAPRLFG